MYDFNRMRLLVSDPDKQMCMLLPINDLSPVSMVPREHDNIKISDAMATIWDEKTTYLGEYDIQSRSVQNRLLGIDAYHIFYNRFGFLHLEQDYLHEGGAHDSETLYLFQEQTE